MIGKTLEYEAKTIRNQGIKIGLEQGKNLGARYYQALLKCLREENNIDLMNRLIDGDVGEDEMEQLYRRYGIGDR